MWNELLPIVALGLLCGSWVVVQRALARWDPGAPGVEGGCHGCRGGCETTDAPAHRLRRPALRVLPGGRR